MNRKTPPASRPRQTMLIEALEPRIAPAGLLNESKFTSVAVGGSLLLDASGTPGTFQGLTTGSGGGSGSYLLYLTSGRALVFTTDINGNGRLDPGEITGISLGKDSLGHDPSLLLFSNINGDIVTNLNGTKGSNLTDSDGNPNNGRDGQLLTDTNIGSITLRALAASDIDTSIPGNTLSARLALTGFAIHGNIVAGGDIGAVTINTIGAAQLAVKFNGSAGDQLYRGATPTISGIYTGTASNNLDFHFTQNNQFTPQVEGTLQGFTPATNEHGGDISNVTAANAATQFSIGTIATGAGGTNARGGNITGVILHGAQGGYQVVAGDGGAGGTGGTGGSIINFNDLGSITSQTVLHTGSGGQGLLGAGGSAGTISLVNPQIAAQVEIFMGSGGAGFTKGGGGASFDSATFNTPETPTAIGGKFYGTWHSVGDVGNTHPLGTTTSTTDPVTGAVTTFQQYAPEVINFNDPSFFGNAADAAAFGDRYGDGVYTSSAPNQVVVVFGDGFGGLNDNGGNFNNGVTATVNLKVPGIVNPVVAIGDFNGDGRPDIAVASGDANTFGGVYVFLNQIGTSLDPINSSNFSHSFLGDHPFSAAHETALPTLADQGLYQTSGGVVALAAGDYNGDGITDIAFVQNVTAEVTLAPFQSVGVLLGSHATIVKQGYSQRVDPTTGFVIDTGTNKPAGTGFFFASTNAPRTAASVLNTIIVPGSGDILQATSFTTTNLPDANTGLPATPESFTFMAQGANRFTTYSLSVDPTTHVASAGLLGVASSLGRVDTNRNIGGNNISLTEAGIEALSIQDLDGDGFADVVALTKQPANFLVTLQGNGTPGAFTVRSGGGDNAGISLGGGVGIAITAVDTNTDPNHIGTFDAVAVVELPANPAPFIEEVLLRGENGGPAFQLNVNGGLNGTSVLNNVNPTNLGREFSYGIGVQDQTVLALDGFYTAAPNYATGENLHPDVGYGSLAPESSAYEDTYLFTFTAPNDGVGGLVFGFTGLKYLTQNGYIIFAGDGGSSTVGAGGKGGVIGAATTALSAGTGAITIGLPAAPSYEGDLFLQGGNGGNGFGAGGSGGDVIGVAVRYADTAGVLTSDVEIHAGNGGNGISGDGGNGGSLSELSIATGREFNAGNAGSGLHGGTGGSITGNGQGVFDTSNDAAILASGNGGEGALQGGSGGSINGWVSQILDFVGTGFTSTIPTLSLPGSLVYTTGSGGNAAGGNGGNGGAIINSSPDPTQNNLSGQLTLATGSGGGGLSGGDGGAINTFINIGTTQSAVPAALTILTGHGGIGVSGAGGTGGGITNFNANATGLSSDIGLDLTGIGRVIAGDGGLSFGGMGGAGGSLTKVVATTTSTPMVVAGGAGGAGLTVGGIGGTVNNVTIDSAALQIGKLLVVGGRGGDATAAQPRDITLAGDSDTSDLAHVLLAFGGTQGMAGNGGSITNLTQPVGAQTAVDLIAGNGGNTPNASTAITSGTGVGRGGTVSNVTLTGTAGALSRDLTLGNITNPAIQAYTATDEFGVTTTGISAIISLLADPNSLFNSFSDNDTGALSNISGNVGIVAGAAGTVRNGQPARDGINGDVASVAAQSFLSVVAGSVEAVAPVRIVSGLTVTNPDGVLGADRSPNSPFSPNGLLDYFTSPTSTTPVMTLQAGYSLIGTAPDGTRLSGDGAIFAATIQSTGGTVIRGPRVFPANTM